MRKPVQICVILFGFVLSACGAETVADNPLPVDEASIKVVETTKTIAVEDEIVIVMLGDSLTAGYGLAPTDALPAQFEKLIKVKHPNVRVINAGVSGDTTANGLARYEWSVASANPQLVVIALGANDYLMGIEPATSRANLSAILEQAQANDHKVILAGLAPRSGLSSGGRDQDYAAIYPDLAEQFDVPLHAALMKGVQGNSELLQADGLHPTKQGVGEMAKHLTQFMAPYLAGLKPEP